MGLVVRLVMLLLRRFARMPGGGLRGAARRIGREGGPRPVARPAGLARRGGQPMRADRDRDDPPNHPPNHPPNPWDRSAGGGR